MNTRSSFKIKCPACVYQKLEPFESQVFIYGYSSKECPTHSFENRKENYFVRIEKTDQVQIIVDVSSIRDKEDFRFRALYCIELGDFYIDFVKGNYSLNIGEIYQQKGIFLNEEYEFSDLVCQWFKIKDNAEFI